MACSKLITVMPSSGLMFCVMAQTSIQPDAPRCRLERPINGLAHLPPSHHLPQKAWVQSKDAVHGKPNAQFERLMRTNKRLHHGGRN